MKIKIATLGITSLFLTPFVVNAEAPTLQSAAPVIYLADNLDEKDKLGWCIDTEGRGFAETLQAHSCKPDRGKANDTQFAYNADTGQIQSVAFEGKCMTLSSSNSDTHPFDLLDCADSQTSQQFSYDPKSMEIKLRSDGSKCVVVSNNSIIAGPFMSRDLIYQDCTMVDAPYKQWVVVN